MSPDLLSLAAFWLSSAYLSARLLELVLRAMRLGIGFVRWRQPGERLLLLQAGQGRGPRRAALTVWLAAILGGLAGLALPVDWSISARLALVLTALAVITTVPPVSAKDFKALDVLLVLSRLRDELRKGVEIGEALVGLLTDLPAGEMRQAVNAAALRRRSGEPLERCLSALGGRSLLLDELLLVLGRGGCQHAVLVERLMERAGVAWDRASRDLALRERLRPALSGLQAGIHAVLALLLARGWERMAEPLLLPGQSLPAVAMYGVTVVLFYFLLKGRWTRLLLALAILLPVVWQQWVGG